MITHFLDANGASQTVVVPSQEAIVDHSGTVAATGVDQTILAANTLRSGWIFQNRGLNPMYINELGVASSGAGSFAVSPGAFFPPAGFPLNTSAIHLVGTLNEAFTLREW